MGVDLSKFYRKLEDPAMGAFQVTPSNTVVFNNQGTNPPMPRSLYVGGAGSIAVVMLDDSSAIFTGVAPGSILPISAKQVLLTGTTATGIIGLY